MTARGVMFTALPAAVAGLLFAAAAFRDMLEKLVPREALLLIMVAVAASSIVALLNLFVAPKDGFPPGGAHGV